MNKILIDFGMLPTDAIEDYISLSNDVQILSEDEHRYEKLITNNIDKTKTFLQPCKFGNVEVKHTFQDIRNKIINDSKIFQLYDRTETPFHTTSKKISVISLKIDRATTFLKKNGYKTIIFNSTPHSCNNWILAKCAELLGVQVLYFKVSVIPWRYHLFEGVNATPKKLKFNDSINEVEKKHILEFITSKKGSRLEALPDYELRRLDANNGKFYSFKKDFIKDWKRPDLVLNKYLCYKKYKSHSQCAAEFKAEKYVLFFLHFQPERTTLPEGYGFSQQVLAIKTLRKCLDKGVKLMVKEHPSTFTNLCHWKERTPDFYDDILGIDGVDLVDIAEDSYSLIDTAQFTATITGTILFESVVRGTPAIAFGLAPILIASTYHRYETEDGLAKFLRGDYVQGYNVLESLACTITARHCIYKKFQKESNLTHRAVSSGIRTLLRESNSNG
jgi:hypothetical protein